MIKNEGTENTREISIKNDGRVRTLADLKRVAKIDTRIWEITNWTANAWETHMRIDDEPVPVTNHQVKARLRRHKLKPLRPQLQPITFIRNKRSTSRNFGKAARDYEIAVLLPDPQFGFSKDIKTGALTPFHDRRALDIAYQLVHMLQPDLVGWLGDTLDVPDWSDKFVRSPEFYWTTQPAVIEAAGWIQAIYAASKRARTVVLKGNHDERIDRAVLTHLNAVYQLRPADELELPPALSMPRLLGLDSMGG